MFPCWMSVTFFWASHICGSTMLFMSPDPVVSLLLWGHLYKIPEVVVPNTIPPKQYLKVVSHTKKFSFFTVFLKDEHNNLATAATSVQ